VEVSKHSGNASELSDVLMARKSLAFLLVSCCCLFQSFRVSVSEHEFVKKKKRKWPELKKKIPVTPSKVI